MEMKVLSSTTLNVQVNKNRQIEEVGGALVTMLYCSTFCYEVDYNKTFYLILFGKEESLNYTVNFYNGTYLQYVFDMNNMGYVISTNSKSYSKSGRLVLLEVEDDKERGNYIN